MALCSLPADILRAILLILPPKVATVATRVNKQLNDVISKDTFWKELCLVHYHGTAGSSKSADESWKQHAFDLEKAPKWNSSHPILHITNKSYSLSYPFSHTPSALGLFLGVADKPLVAGPFSGRYFEVVVDSLPDSESETAQIIIGLAPHNILLNPTWDKVFGYNNMGMSNMGTCGKPFGVGDRIGVLLNTEYMTVSFLKNDVLQGTPYVHLDRHIPFHPVVGLLKGGGKVTIPLPPLKEPPLMPIR